MPASTDPAQPTSPQQLVDYVNATAAVTAYAAAVAQTRLPALVLTPPWYSSYADQFTLAQAHAQAWLDGTLPEISALPAALVDNDAIVRGAISAAQEALQALAAAPADPAKRQAAVAALTNLGKATAPVQRALDGLRRTLSSFAGQLAGDATTLSGMAQAAGTAAGADAAAVAQLQGVIADLRTAIDARTQAANLDNLVKGELTVLIVMVAAAVGWAGGPLVGGLLGLAAAGLLTTSNLMPGLDDQTSVRIETDDGSHTLMVGTNQTSGTSPSPLDGTDGYNYEYVVLLSDQETSDGTREKPAPGRSGRPVNRSARTSTTDQD